MNEDQAARVQAMLEVMWKNSRSIIAERIQTLRGAEESLAGGSLEAVDRKDAESAAHKLAGILGTFGLPEGSVLASKIERMMAQKAEISDWQRSELNELLGQLEVQIKSKDENTEFVD
jgi:HPt (histidine-containing phosphotransfer) domain-containing protein